MYIDMCSKQKQRKEKVQQKNQLLHYNIHDNIYIYIYKFILDIIRIQYIHTQQCINIRTNYIILY